MERQIQNANSGLRQRVYHESLESLRYESGKHLNRVSGRRVGRDAISASREHPDCDAG